MGKNTYRSVRNHAANSACLCAEAHKSKIIKLQIKRLQGHYFYLDKEKK